MNQDLLISLVDNIGSYCLQILQEIQEPTLWKLETRSLRIELI